MPIFPGGGGGSAPAGLPSYSVFVSPTGNDGGSGSQGSPFKTMYKAVQNVIAAGGGTINFNDGVTVGGPIADQGLWLRNDDIAVPGFLDINNKPLFFSGNGAASAQGGNSSFQRPGAAQMVGGSSTDFTKPGLWVVGSEVPITIQYMLTRVGSNGNVCAPVRLGWDYVRKTDFSLEALTVSSVTRTGTSSVMSVTISTASAWTITAAARDADDKVTLTLTRPLTVAMAPWTIGAPIRVNTGGDTDFPDVDAIVTDQSDQLTLQGQTSITVSYTQAGATTSKSLSGTVKSHGLQAGDYLAQFFPTAGPNFGTCCQMLVTAATIDTVTVFDPFGGNATKATPGTITKQLRGREVADSIEFDFCSFYGQVQTSDDGNFGPTVDMGGTSVGIEIFKQCYVGGGLAWDHGAHPANVDPRRTNVSILADPGAGTLSGASLQFEDCQSQSGSLRWYPHGTEAEIQGDGWLQDSGGQSYPTIVCGDGTTFANVNLTNIGNADGTTAAVEIGSGYDSLKVNIGVLLSSSTLPLDTDSPVTGPTNIRAALWAAGATASPWELGWRGSWPGGLTTPHVGPNRALGALQARYANLVPAFDQWVGVAGAPAGYPTGITVTRDGASVDGSAGAFKIVATGSFVAGTIPIGQYPNSLNASVGDRVVIGCWIKSSGDCQFVAQSYTTGDVKFGGLDVIRSERHIAVDGWQWCTTYAIITAIVSTGHYFLSIQAPTGAGTHYIDAPTFVYVPSSVPAADFFEFAGTFKHQPLYLPPGMVGTLEGRKFIGHGGLGTALTYVEGVGSGQLTVVGSYNPKRYEPKFAEDGVTIRGWYELINATINP